MGGLSQMSLELGYRGRPLMTTHISMLADEVRLVRTKYSILISFKNFLLGSESGNILLLFFYKNIVRCDGGTFPDVTGTWIQRTSIDDVGCLWQKCSLLLFCKGLILALSIETLSDRLDKSFHDAILMTCVRYISLPFEIATEILG